MKIKCRLGWHSWSKWENKGTVTMVCHVNPYAPSFDYEYPATELVRTCSCCGLIDRKYLK